jgi:hypothetical protein
MHLNLVKRSAMSNRQMYPDHPGDTVIEVLFTIRLDPVDATETLGRALLARAGRV